MQAIRATAWATILGAQWGESTHSLLLWTVGRAFRALRKSTMAVPAGFRVLGGGHRTSEVCARLFLARQHEEDPGNAQVEGVQRIWSHTSRVTLWFFSSYHRLHL